MPLEGGFFPCTWRPSSRFRLCFFAGAMTAPILGLQMVATSRPVEHLTLKNILAGLLVVTAITGSALSWFASAKPDGPV